jgi:hypothetical protein
LCLSQPAEPARIGEFVDHGLATETAIVAGLHAAERSLNLVGDGPRWMEAIARSHPMGLAVSSLQVRRIKTPGLLARPAPSLATVLAKNNQGLAIFGTLVAFVFGKTCRRNQAFPGIWAEKAGNRPWRH